MGEEVSGAQLPAPVSLPGPCCFREAETRESPVFKVGPATLSYPFVPRALSQV